MDTVQVSVELPRHILSAFRQEPSEFVGEMRLAAAVKWYELRMLSQGKAAAVAGISRAEFLTGLNRYGVTPFQYESAEELRAESCHSSTTPPEQDPLWDIVDMGCSSAGDLALRHDDS